MPAMPPHNSQFLPTAQYLISIGLCPVLLMGKKPVFTTYTDYLAGPPGKDEMALPVERRPLRYSGVLLAAWDAEYPGANVGMLTRDRPCIDVDDVRVWDAIRDIVPVTPHIKRGARGFTLVYSVHPTDPVLRTRTFIDRFSKTMLVEVLAEGRQTVLPPSIHPDGMQYEWVGMPEWGFMCPTPLDARLPPALSQAVVNAIESKLADLGLTKHRVERGKGLATRLPDGERRRYEMYVLPKLREKVAAVREAPAGSRQDALNGAVYALAPWVREAFITEAWLEGEMRSACEVNGYIRDDGDKAFVRQLDKALDDGWNVELPDLDAGRAAQLMGTAPLASGAPAVAAGYAAPVEFWTYDGTLPPEEPELIRRLLPAAPGSLAFVAGKSGMGKSFYVAAMAVALGIGVGTTFFGHPVRERVGTIIIAAEGAGGMRARLFAAAQAMGATNSLPIVVVPSCGNLSIEADRAAMQGALMRAAEHLRLVYGVRVGAVVLDTMLAAFGMEDEGASAEAQKVCGYMRDMAVTVDAIMVAVHHVGKDDTQGMRGSSAFYAAADYVVICGGVHDHVTGKTENRFLAIDKSRNDTTGPISNVVLEIIGLGINQYGDVRTTCFYRMGEGEVDPMAHRRKPDKSEFFDKAYDICIARNAGKPSDGLPALELRMQFDLIYPSENLATKRKAWERLKDKMLSSKRYRFYQDIWFRETIGVTSA
ncbi:MAG TPA: AAA family ATPase [Candidatus Saccharimonadia bacterium]|nr:AAA family ATPase [Candidatus Saccharimonadia bacterium]